MTASIIAASTATIAALHRIDMPLTPSPAEGGTSVRSPLPCPSVGSRRALEPRMPRLEAAASRVSCRRIDGWMPVFSQVTGYPCPPHVYPRNSSLAAHMPIVTTYGFPSPTNGG